MRIAPARFADVADSPEPPAGPTPSPGFNPNPHAVPSSIDALLPVKPTPDANGMVVVGHLHVQGSLYGKMREALVYDSKNPETVAMVDRLVQGPRDTTLQHTSGVPFTRPELDGGATVGWNPSSMFIDDRGGRHSAAAIVGHELSHADRLTQNDHKYFADKESGKDGAFTNREEHNAVNSENATSRATGESTRTNNNKGQFLTSRGGVTSTEPILNVFRNGVPHELPNGYSQSGKITAITDTSVIQEIRKGETVAYPKTEVEALAYPGKVHVGENLSVAVHGHEVSVREVPAHALPGQGHGR